MEKDTDNIGLYFVAIIPPSPIYEEAWKLKNYFKDAYSSKASLNSPPHVTLHMPFKWKVEKENALVEKLEKFAHQFAPFDLSFSNFNCFEPRVIYIDVIKNEKLNSLQKELHRLCKKELNLFNANYKEHAFHAHLTLAFRDLRKQQFLKAWEEFNQKTFTGEFTVNEIALLKHTEGSWRIVKTFEFSFNK